jgi:putative cell wall-binding protein
MFEIGLKEYRETGKIIKTIKISMTNESPENDLVMKKHLKMMSSSAKPVREQRVEPMHIPRF